MNTIENHPERLFLWASAFFLPFFISTFYINEGLDIQVHDTYFVIASYHVFVLPLLYFGIPGLSYFILKNILNRSLNNILILIHFLCFTTVFFLIFEFVSRLIPVSFSGRYYSYAAPIAYHSYTGAFTVINEILMTGFFFGGIILYFTIIVLSFLKKK